MKENFKNLKITNVIKMIGSFVFLILLWSTVFLLPPIIIYRMNFDIYFYTFYLVVSVCVYIWLSRDNASYVDVQRTYFHQSPKIIFSLFWYFYLYLLPFFLIWTELKSPADSTPFSPLRCHESYNQLFCSGLKVYSYHLKV